MLSVLRALGNKGARGLVLEEPFPGSPGLDAATRRKSTWDPLGGMRLGRQGKGFPGVAPSERAQEAAGKGGRLSLGLVEEAGDAGVISLVGAGNVQGGRDVEVWLGTKIRMRTG